MVLIIIILLLLFYYRIYRIQKFNNSMHKVDINDLNLENGDIIGFYKPDFIYNYGENGINYNLHFVNYFIKSLLFLIYPNYIHFGIIKKINNKPYLLHLTGDTQFDVIKNKWTKGSTSIVNIDELVRYNGYVYIHKCKKKIDNLLYDELKLNGSLFGFIKGHVLNYDYDDNYGLCVDQVKRTLYKNNLVDNCSNSSINDIRRVLKDFEPPVLLNNTFLIYNGLKK